MSLELFEEGTPRSVDKVDVRCVVSRELLQCAMTGHLGKLVDTLWVVQVAQFLLLIERRSAERTHKHRQLNSSNSYNSGWVSYDVAASHASQAEGLGEGARDQNVSPCHG